MTSLTSFFSICYSLVGNIDLCNNKPQGLKDDQILLFERTIQINYMQDLGYKDRFQSVLQIKQLPNKKLIICRY
jgi:hypothetical protein